MDLDFSKLSNDLLTHLPSILLALVTLFVGWRIIRWLTELIKNTFEGKGTDPAVVSFAVSLVSILLKVLLLFSVLEMVGVETASFVAVLAAASFAVGMALQGSLSNFAAGVMVLFFKPYRVGDIIELSDAKGKVISVQIFNTILRTPKNETVIIPNSAALSDKIINHSTAGNIRVDLFFHMPYEEQFETVQSIVMELVRQHPKILREPRSSVDIESFESHNINVGVFVFCLPDDYWEVYYDLNNAIKKALGAHHIKVAYSEGVELGNIGSK